MILTNQTRVRDMADPTGYDKDYDFSNFQATKPDEPLPGDRLDTELQNIETAIDETQTALQDVRRSDGQLQNRIVGLDALTPELLDAFETGGIPAFVNVVGVVSGDGATKVFGLPVSVASKNNVDVIINGVQQFKSSYEVSGNQITFVTAPPAGTNNIEFNCKGDFSGIVDAQLDLMFDGRAALESWIAAGNTVAAGKILHDGTVSYTFIPAGHPLFGTNPIPDLPGLINFGDLHPEHGGAVGDGTTDDLAAITVVMALGSWTGLPGKVYRITGNVVQTAAGVVDFNGAAVSIDVNANNDTSYIALAEGTVAYNVDIRLPSGADIKRWIKTADGVKIYGLSLYAEDQIALGGDNLDAALYLTGDGVRVYRVRSENIDRAIVVVDDVSDFAIDGFDAYSYLQGINLRGGTGDKGRISKPRGHTLSPNAGTDPGHNLITGRQSNLIVEDVDVYASGEHGLYISDDSTKIPGLTLRDVRTHGTGQCGVKLRNMENFAIDGLSTQDCATGNATGTNEDPIRLESCDNGVIKGFSAQKNSKSNCGYDGIHIDNCNDLTFVAPSVDAPVRALVRVEDTRGASSGIKVVAPDGQNMGGAQVLSVEGTGSNFGDIFVEDMTASGLTTEAVKVDVTGSLGGPIRCSGAVYSTEPAVFNNVNSTSNVTVRVDYNGNRDFYEAGTWSPTYFAESTAFSSITYNKQEGVYVRTGQLVFASARLRSATISGGSGDVSVGGFPFSAQNTTNNNQPIVVGYAEGFTGDHPSGGFMVNGADRAALNYRSSSNGASQSLGVADLNTSAGNDIIFSSTYMV